PTINTVEVDEAYRHMFDYALGQPVEKPVRYAMNNTFGFGGHIATSIFKKYEP
ncbi:MAG: beta-ketoacyl-[acyl-carrier-protein] synthase II, partial [Chitinophagia bacterium]|nr:beta-ketoacyl-[acyl-carrier-protein] synthase II [Chitinophagia bacterium]